MLGNVRGPKMALNYCDGMSSSRSGGSVGLASDAADQAALPSYDKSRTALVRRARTMNRILATTYPDAHIELDFSNPLELLVATILSAQSTDKRVNLITPVVFARYPDAAAYAAADRADLEELIKPTGFFRAKTDTLIKLGAALTERFGGEVPKRMKDLGHSPRRRPQDRQCGARQRLRYSGHHCGYPFRTTRAPVRMDHRNRPGQGRTCSRRTLPAQGLDAALPQHHLAWPAPLSCPEPGVRRLPDRSLVPRVRGRRDRSDQGCQAGAGAAGMK